MMCEDEKDPIVGFDRVEGEPIRLSQILVVKRVELPASQAKEGQSGEEKKDVGI